MPRRVISAREALKYHSWAIGLMESRNPGPANPRNHNAVMGCLREAGFSFETVVHTYSVQDAYIYGFALQKNTLGFATPASTGSWLTRERDRTSRASASSGRSQIAKPVFAPVVHGPRCRGRTQAHRAGRMTASDEPLFLSPTKLRRPAQASRACPVGPPCASGLHWKCPTRTGWLAPRPKTRCWSYRICIPEIARAITSCWISAVPSKMS